jgi:hypothetical protein
MARYRNGACVDCGSAPCECDEETLSEREKRRQVPPFKEYARSAKKIIDDLQGPQAQVVDGHHRIAALDDE